MIGVREKVGPTPHKIRGEISIDGRLRKRFTLVFVGVGLSCLIFWDGGCTTMSELSSDLKKCGRKEDMPTAKNFAGPTVRQLAN